MKYLKLFEIHTWQSMAINRYRQKKKKIYKKYIVDDARKEEENIYVWEVVKYGEISKLGDEIIDLILRYKYSVGYNRFEDEEDEGTLLIKDLDILYETDILEDAYDFLVAMLEADKYNL